MIITEKIINHYFPRGINAYKDEYFILFGLGKRPEKGWKYLLLGKELSEKQMEDIEDYFQNHIAPKLRPQTDLFTGMTFDDMSPVE